MPAPPPPPRKRGWRRLGRVPRIARYAPAAPSARRGGARTRGGARRGPGLYICSDALFFGRCSLGAGGALGRASRAGAPAGARGRRRLPRAHAHAEPVAPPPSLLLPLPMSLLYTPSLPPYCCPYPCPYCTLFPRARGPTLPLASASRLSCRAAPCLAHGRLRVGTRPLSKALGALCS